MSFAMDWRHSYAVMVRDWVEELRSYRKRGLSMVFETSRGKVRRAYELSDDDIHDIARRQAERDVQVGINKHNESQAAQKLRKGYAA